MRGNQVSPRLHQIDGLRAFASCLVVMHHAGTSALGQALAERGHVTLGNWISSVGASGVEMFFVLSGVVLLRPCLRHDRSAELLTYMKRRLERLWPPFFVAWLMAGGFVFLTSRHPTWWSQTSDLPSFAMRTWLEQLGIVYFGPLPYNFAWWSLSLEIQFYMLVPLIIWGRSVFQWLRGYLDYVCFVVAIVISLVFGAPALSQRFPSEVSGLLSYASCFMAGIVLAKRDVSARLAWSAIVSGAALIALASAFPALNVHVGWGLLYFGWVARLVVAPPGFLARWHLVWLGERSYSLFLAHYTVFGLVSYVASLLISHKSASYLIVTRAVELPLALFVAMVLFHLVERRFATNLVTADQFWPIAPSAPVTTKSRAKRPVGMTEAQPSP